MLDKFISTKHASSIMGFLLLYGKEYWFIRSSTSADSCTGGSQLLASAARPAVCQDSAMTCAGAANSGTRGAEVFRVPPQDHFYMEGSIGSSARGWTRSREVPQLKNIDTFES